MDVELGSFSAKIITNWFNSLCFSGTVKLREGSLTTILQSVHTRTKPAHGTLIAPPLLMGLGSFQ